MTLMKLFYALLVFATAGAIALTPSQAPMIIATALTVVGLVLLIPDN